MVRETLRLFNAVEVTETTNVYSNRAFLPRMIRNGYILSPQIQANPSLLDTIEDVIGISGEKGNASLHKSWHKVKDASIVQLLFEQILHYITTYGFENIGIFDDDTVYIPAEQLDVPGIEDGIRLTVIKAMTGEQIADSLLELGASGIALAEDTLNDIMWVIKTLPLDRHYNVALFAALLKNRELKIRVYDLYSFAPDDPEEWLRFALYKLTGETLLIKNRYMVNKIKEAESHTLTSVLVHAPKDLASIFYRYKPLFLAMKSIAAPKLKYFFNRLRKDAPKMHKPVRPDYLNTLTENIGAPGFTGAELPYHLVKATIWRKIRLAQALQFRMGHPESVVYRVRNGRGYATDFNWPVSTETTAHFLGIVLDSIADDLTKNVKGKTVYIPKGIEYALPASEKQFVGNVPAGTRVKVDGDMVVGIHWFNNGRRTDLDLSLTDAIGKMGWDATWRTGDCLFSGDVTNAPRPHGASELFHVQSGNIDPYTMQVNYYNFYEGDECEAKIIIAEGDDINENYVLNPNKVAALANINITEKQTALGLIVDNSFVFYSAAVGDGITAKNDDVMKHMRQYLVSRAQTTVSLNTVLRLAGARVIAIGTGYEPVDIDLSLENLDKLTILNLLK